MRTLIELYDERPVENVLATEVFHPEKTVFLCPPEIAGSLTARRKICRYFRHRGLSVSVVFLAADMMSAENVAGALRSIAGKYPDPALDITGGTDAALFAAGLACTENGIPAFTYSRKRNCFFDIYRAPFAQSFVCKVRHRVEDCFYMAGGSVREGRVDNRVLVRYLDKIDSFFRLYMRHRSLWQHAVTFFQRTSRQDKEGKYSLAVEAPFFVKGEKGTRIEAPVPVLRELADIGFLKDLEIDTETVIFSFADSQVRAWLRDVGSVLELYIYKVCLDCGCFYDVRTSVVVDWEADEKRCGVTNEIDVMATQGIRPLFISCKTCRVDTDALNELAVLRDRFGGNMAKAVVVTAQTCRAVTRHRASELGIRVVDLYDLEQGHVGQVLAALMNEKN